jgi:hypothetical protein
MATRKGEPNRLRFYVELADRATTMQLYHLSGGKRLVEDGVARLDGGWFELDIDAYLERPVADGGEEFPPELFAAAAAPSFVERASVDHEWFAVRILPRLKMAGRKREPPLDQMLPGSANRYGLFAQKWSQLVGEYPADHHTRLMMLTYLRFVYPSRAT